MLKRLLALILICLSLASAAYAQDGSFATYQLPQGAQACYITQMQELDVPEGLEPMYNLMQHATLQGDIYLIRMPNGRALVSVGCSPVEEELSAGELLALWPQVALSIGREAEWVNDAPECAAVENRFGFDLLHITTQISAGKENALLLDAEAFAFWHEDALIEVWAVQPADPVYLYDEKAAQELADDREALALFLGSLDFTGQIPGIQSEDYSDPDGRFTMQIVSGSTVITAGTPMEQVSAAREQFISANEEGADKVFDEMMSDVYEQQVTLVLLPDMKGALEVFCSREENFAGATPEMLATLAEPIRKSLSDRFGIAVTLNAEGRATISQKEHAHLCYWVRSEKCNVQLDALACVVGEDWLCEVDLYSIDGDQTVRAILHSLVAQTLRYTVE